MLANLVFTALLTVQLTQVLGDYIKPQITQTWEEEVPLGTMEFPLVIKICVVPGFNQEALQEVGYEDTYAYFLGLNDIDNGNNFGWAGHTGDSGTFGTVEEVLAKVSDFKIEQIVELNSLHQMLFHFQFMMWKQTTQNSGSMISRLYFNV